VAEIEAQMFSFVQKFNRRTELEYSAKSAILPNMIDFEFNLPLKFSMTKKKCDELRINRIEALTLVTAQTPTKPMKMPYK